MTAVQSGLLIAGVAILIAAWRSGRSPGGDGGHVSIARFGIGSALVLAPFVEANFAVLPGILRIGVPLLILVTAMVSILLALRAEAKVRVPALVFGPAFVSALAFIVNSVQNGAGDAFGTFGRLLIVAMWVAFGVLVSIANFTPAGLSRLIGTGLAFALIAGAFVSEATRLCDRFKCGPLGVNLTGPFSSENLLGQFAAVAILACFLPSRKAFRLVLGGIAVSVLYLTESRTSQLALAIAVVAYFVGRVILARLRFGRGILVVASLATIMGIGVMVLFTSDPTAFSNRGWFWHQAILALDSSWVFGRGSQYWETLQSIGLLPPLYPHSQYLLLIFWGGVVCLVVWLVVLSQLVLRAFGDPTTGSVAFAFAVLISVLGITEAFWNPLAVDSRTALLVPMLVLAVHTSRAREHDGQLTRSLRTSSD